MPYPLLIKQLPAHHLYDVLRSPQPLAPQPCAGTKVVHDHAVISLGIRGRGEFWAGTRYEISKGSVMLLPEGTAHYAHHEEQPEWIGLALCTHCMRSPWATQLDHLFEEVRQGYSAVRQAPLDTQTHLRALLERLDDESRKTRPSSLRVDGLMSTLTADLHELFMGERELVTESSPTLVSKALTYIQSHATQAISLVDVAAHVGRHPSHVALTVKNASGRTVVEWITHVRMSQARQLLLTHDETMEWIAERVGFASASHFHRTFKRWHQVSPARWRRQHQA